MDKIYNYTDEELKTLIEKYKQNKIRYDLIYNETTEINDKIILNLHLEQIRRWREKHVSAYRDAS